MTGLPVTTPEPFVPFGLLPAALPPLRKHIDAYLDYKTNRITKATMKGYRSVLRAFETHFASTELSEFEPPAGTTLVEDFRAICQVTISRKAFPLSVIGAFS